MLPDRSVLIGQKLVEKAKIQKIQMRHFGWFSNTVPVLGSLKLQSSSKLRFGFCLSVNRRPCPILFIITTFGIGNWWRFLTSDAVYCIDTFESMGKSRETNNVDMIPRIKAKLKPKQIHDLLSEVMFKLYWLLKMSKPVWIWGNSMSITMNDQ